MMQADWSQYGGVLNAWEDPVLKKYCVYMHTLHTLWFRRDSHAFTVGMDRQMLA